MINSTTFMLSLISQVAYSAKQLIFCFFPIFCLPPDLRSSAGTEFMITPEKEGQLVETGSHHGLGVRISTRTLTGPL